MNLKGRSFLKLLDFTPAEITYLLGLAAELKAKKKRAFPTASTRGRTSRCCLKRIPPAPAAPLRWRGMIWAWA